MGDWTFFSNHGHVLVCLAANREVRLRDVATEVGITERAVQKIVRDFQDAGIVSVSKQGRCNRYRINKRKALRHNLVSHCTVGKLLSLVAKPVGGSRKIEDEPEETQRVFNPVVNEPKPEPKPEAEPEAPPEPSSGPAPVDPRQQGRLF
ncbi:hypothetical protein ACFL1C_08855 [Pseudomonadota bacterium]